MPTVKVSVRSLASNRLFTHTAFAPCVLFADRIFSRSRPPKAISLLPEDRPALLAPDPLLCIGVDMALIDAPCLRAGTETVLPIGNAGRRRAARKARAPCHPDEGEEEFGSRSKSFAMGHPTTPG